MRVDDICLCIIGCVPHVGIHDERCRCRAHREELHAPERRKPWETTPSFEPIEMRVHAYYANNRNVMFEPGNWVRYVPTHAHGNANHPDCQDGVVKRYSDDGKTVFVLYDNKVCKMMTGNELYTAQGTNRDDLVFLGRRRT